MEHLAIMKKSLWYLEKIVFWDKTIETRWYRTKRSPWNKIKKWENIYFKNTWEFVTLKAKVKEVIQFENLDTKKIKSILNEYWEKIWIDDNEIFFENIKDKKYCILIFLEDIQKIESFNIDKKWFWLMSAWVSIEDIDLIKI